MRRHSHLDYLDGDDDHALRGRDDFDDQAVEEESPLQPRNITRARRVSYSTMNGQSRGVLSSHLDASQSCIPPNLNWLNVPDAVQETFLSLDGALMQSRKEMKRMESIMRKMETRIIDLERMNDRLVNVVKSEREKSQLLRTELDEIANKRPSINEDEIVHRAMEELRRQFKPEEVRQTLKKVEIAAKQPLALMKRVETLEQFRISSQARASAQEQMKKAQRARVEDAVSALRKLSI